MHCTSVVERVESLSAYVICKVACGESHTLAVNEWGQVFSWGSSSHGQLGKIIVVIVAVKLLLSLPVCVCVCVGGE